MTTPPGGSDADDLGQYVGLTGDAARDLAAERGWFPRVLRPGDMATMDFREDRLNLVLDDAGSVARAYAG